MRTEMATTQPAVTRRTSTPPPVAPAIPPAPRNARTELAQVSNRPRKDWLAESLLELSPTRPKRSFSRVVLSVGMHVVLVAAVLLPPLYFTQTIDLKQFTQTLLVGPPPPPPAPPAPQALAKRVPVTKRLFTENARLLAPSVIPRKIAMLKEEPLTPENAEGVFGGVPGGVPGGQAGGVIGGIISGSTRAVPAPPSAPRPKTPVRVGGRVKAPRLIQQVQPKYPVLAMQTHLQGQVTLDAIIDTQGKVIEVRAISGHALLIPAAMDAVGKWKYEPTYLNDVPITVQLIVTVTFQLSR